MWAGNLLRWQRLSSFFLSTCQAEKWVLGWNLGTLAKEGLLRNARPRPSRGHSIITGRNYTSPSQ